MGISQWKTAAVVMFAASIASGCLEERPGLTSDMPLSVSPGSEQMSALTVATVDNAYATRSYQENLPVWQEVERRTGVKIVWDVTAENHYVETMNLRIRKGSELPDIFLIPDTDPTKAADAGHIIPLDALIAEHAPHIAKFLQENPDIDKRLRSPDGKLYALSSVVTGVRDTDPYGILIRQDWLDRLGLEEPQTLEEWYEVLNAFKQNDPNGNGIKDEIPLLPDKGLRGLTLFGSAIGGHFYFSDGYYPDASGKIRYEWLSPEAEGLVGWMSRLYREQLIAPDYLSITEEAYLTAITSGKVGVTSGFLNAKSKYEAGSGKVGDNRVEWVMAVPPSGPGHQGHYETYGPISGWYGISRDSKNPELAIRWLDFIYANEEGSRLLNFGIEGVSYTMVDGFPSFSESARNNPEMLDLTSLLRSLGAMPKLPWIRADKGPLSLQPIAFMDYDPKGAEQARKVKPYLIESVPLSIPARDEKETLEQYGGPLRSYVNLTLARFIAGTEPIDWQAFRQNIKSRGIDRLLDVKQRQYDRYNSK